MSKSAGFTGPELVAWMREHGWTVAALALESEAGERSVCRWRAGGCSLLLSLGIKALGTRVQI